MRKTLETARAALTSRARVRLTAASACAAVGLAVVPVAAVASVDHKEHTASAERAQHERAEQREAARAEAARKAEQAREADEARKAAQAAQAARRAEEARKAEDARRAEEARKAEDAKKAAAAKAAVKKRAVTQAVSRSRPAQVSSSGWTRPVNGYSLSAGYAQSGARWSAKHSGQDFAVPTGTPVRAVHAGVVVTAGWGGAYGNNIVVRHANGLYSQYAHLSRIAVAPGQHVGVNQEMGRSGNTGNSTGPHLHFEIRTTASYGSAVEPLSFLRRHGVGV
ncbi:hypothetical protein GCM10027168_03410 [Streptomyces capparidis]